MLPLRQGEIIEKVVHCYLRVVAVNNTLVQTVEDVPFLIAVPHKAGALAGESPGGRVHHGRAENGCVSQGEAFTVVRQSLLGRGSWQERGLRIRHILQVTAPE